MNADSGSVRCPACGESAAGDSVSEVWSLTQCRACTHVFSRNQPDNRLYEDFDYVAWRAKAKEEFLQTARRRHGTVKSRLAGGQGRVLELGCSTGEVLAEFSRNGWQAMGSDFSQAAITAASETYPQINFCTLNEQELLRREGPDAFDLIMAFHVIEHVPDLDQMLDALQALCKPDGHLFLAFPNWEAWSRKVFGDAWPDLAPEHLHFFTRESVRRWLQRGGFEIVHMDNWGRAWQWLGGAKRVVRGSRPASKDITTEKPATMPGHRAHSALRMVEKAMWPFLELEAALGGGSELAVIARNVRR